MLAVAGSLSGHLVAVWKMLLTTFRQPISTEEQAQRKWTGLWNIVLSDDPGLI